MRRAVIYYPRYHSNCKGRYPCATSDSIKPYALTQHSRKGSTCRKGFLPFNSGATANCFTLAAHTDRRLSRKLRRSTLHHRFYYLTDTAILPYIFRVVNTFSPFIKHFTVKQKQNIRLNPLRNWLESLNFELFQRKRKNRLSLMVKRFLTGEPSENRCFASCLLDDRKLSLAVPVCASASLKTIINRFLYARCPLRVRISSILQGKNKKDILADILSIFGKGG